MEAKKTPAPPGATVKASGHVVLTASITDFDLWDAVVAKLNGLRIYTMETFHEEIIEVTQKRAQEATTRAAMTIDQLRAEREKLRQEVDFMRAEFEGREAHPVIISIMEETAAVFEKFTKKNR